ncbi:MAG TPA: hypothetical protein VGO28_09150 [Acidimicrobiia bacterium]
MQFALGAAQLSQEIGVVLGGRLGVLRAGDQVGGARDVEVDGPALAEAAIERGGALVDQIPEPGDLRRRGVQLLLGVVRRGLRLLQAVLGAVVLLGKRVELPAVRVDLVLQRLRLRLLVVDGVGVGTTTAARDQRDERDDERERGDPPCVPGAERTDGSIRRGRCGWCVQSEESGR